MGIETHLVKKIAREKIVCTNCDKQINEGEAYHLEKGVSEHLHSLLARKYCSDCYSKYGEIKLLSKKK